MEEAACIFSELKKRLGDGKEWKDLALDDCAEDFLNPVKNQLWKLLKIILKTGGIDNEQSNICRKFRT